MDALIIITVILIVICVIMFAYILHLIHKNKMINNLPESKKLEYLFDNAIISCKQEVYFRDKDCNIYNDYNIHSVNVTKNSNPNIIIIDLIKK